jgi:osmotically-inducible protein OsmY
MEGLQARGLSMRVDRGRLERAIQDLAGVNAAVEIRDDDIIVTGMVLSDRERQAALDIVRELAPDANLIEELEVTSVLPDKLDELDLSETEVEGFAGALTGTSDNEALEPGDFTDQDLQQNPNFAAGPSGTADPVDDEISEGDEVFVPPTDPVRTSDNEVLGGFQSSAMDDNQEVRSEVVGGPADEAIANAVREELLQDAATTALEIRVHVYRGVVVLRGVVDDLDDADNAADVASRVPGVTEVRDELEVRSAGGAT